MTMWQHAYDWATTSQLLTPSQASAYATWFTARYPLEDLTPLTGHPTEYARYMRELAA